GAVVGGGGLRQGDLLAVAGGLREGGDLQGGGVVGAGNPLADPHRRGDELVAVLLGGLEPVVLAVGDVQGGAQLDLAARDAGELAGDLAAVGVEDGGGEGVLRGGVTERDVEGELGGVGREHGAHLLAV